MIGLVCGIAALVLAAIPAVMFVRNLMLYRTPALPRIPQTPSGVRIGSPLPGFSSGFGAVSSPEDDPNLAPDGVRGIRGQRISVLIPARNEALSIAAAVESALASRDIVVEVIVLDDHSTDATASLVQAIAARDDRVRLLTAPPLPEGWCGKQHACHVLSGAAKYDLFAFLDADVRLSPDGLARLSAFQRESNADLVSGIPHQETGSLLEKLTIPLIHFVLLGFLPIARMRQSTHPSYGSGCGQLFLTRREAYQEIGGHSAIRTTLHDGLKLPRAFRSKGKMTDLCDATELATCRMYRSAGEVWRGLSKNATEGLASPGMIVPATVLLLGGQVMPFVLLCCAAWLTPTAVAVAAVAAGLAYAPRFVGAERFRQSWLGAVLHPIGVLTLLAIQWCALGRAVLGRPAAWKGREYQRAATPPLSPAIAAVSKPDSPESC